MTREPTDTDLDLLVYELGLDLDGLDPDGLDPAHRADLIARTAAAGHRIGDGHRPFPPECDTERGAVRIGTVVLVVVALGICCWLATAAGLIHLTGATR